MLWTVQLELLGSVLVTLGFAASTIWIIQSSKRPNLDAFPTVGSSGLWGGIKFMTNAAAVAREGYRKHKGAPFKIATLYRWAVVVSSRAHIEELRNAPEDELLFEEPAYEDLNAEYMMEAEYIRIPYHTIVIRSQLTRNIGVLLPEVKDEVVTAFDEILDLKDNDWKSVLAFPAIQQVVCRASNRVFVGLPLCRNSDFVAFNIQDAINIRKAGDIAIGFLPASLKDLVARLIARFRKDVLTIVADQLRPTIEERRKYLNALGSGWDEKPRDLLSWLMDEAGPNATVEMLARYVLSANFTVIQTSPSVFTNAIYNLATNPQYVQPLREEVESIVEKEGWSKMSLSKMRRVDSFLKETIRMDNSDMLGMMRKTAKDFMFSDGTLIPKGTRVYVPIIAIHYDETLYRNPEVFDPFRFANMGEDGGGAKHQFSATSHEYLAFGHGRHACPGRFFAATVLKMMFAHLVITYDVKLEGTSARPQSIQSAAHSMADPTTKVMFRKRIQQDAKY